MWHFRKQSGYSLLELLVYVALFSALSVLLVKSLVTSLNVYAAAQSYRRVQSEGQLVMDQLVREVRNATSVTVAASTFGTSPGVLVLVGEDDSGAARTVTFSVINNRLQINDNGTIGTLSSATTTVNNLIFRNITTGVSSAIKIELTLGTTIGRSITSSFYNTVLLRGY